MKKKQIKKKIDWKRLAKKSMEDAVKKAIELLVVLIVVGAATKLIFVAVPAIAFGSAIAKLINVKFLG